MTEDYHIDLSIRLFDKGTTGIACVGAKTKKHNGCALSSRLKKYINKTLCIGSIKEERAKLYAICIYYLIRNKLEDIKTLIICNDENFNYVREYLYLLLNDTTFSFRIISITEFQKRLGRKVKSLADNFAKAYRKRSLKRNRWHVGKKLNVVEITYNMIKNKWKQLDKV